MTKSMSCAILLLAGLSLPAEAAGTHCSTKQAVEDFLRVKFGEIAFASGVSFKNAVKFYGNPKSGSWSMVVNRPDGTACIIATGDSLEVTILALAHDAAD